MPATLLLLGDSLTQQGYQENGWVAQIANAYVRKALVLNRGLSGYNTRWAQPVISHVLSQADPPLFATVWFGANDAVLAETGSAQHVPLPQFTSTLTQIVREVQAHARFVLLLTPPPVDEEARMQWQRNTLGQSTGPERTDASAARYADACRQVAAACNVTMVDVRGAFLSTPDYKALLSDGLHLSPAGSDVVFATVMRTVRDHLPTECWPENMPLDFPDWKDLA